MKIRILSVSKTKQRFIREGEDEYLKRLRNYVQIERAEIADELPATLPEAQVMAREGEAVLSKLKKDEFLVVLDERGKELNSQEFASFLDDKMQRGNSKFCFVIGGAYGLDEKVKKEAGLLLSLSRLTFPYQLTRLILVEQLYRAFSILKGIPYHK